jgi:hypothetical protein
MARDRDEVAFTNIEKVLTVGQFETLVTLAKQDYDSLAKAIKTKEGFEAKALKKFEEETGTMPPGFLDKLVKGLVRKAEKEFDAIFKDEMARSEDVLEFLNTFRTRDNQLPRLI